MADETKWVQFCKRTDDPKLAWIERELDKLGIKHRREGESWHAPILEVEEAREQDANAILMRKVGRYTIDDIRDDHPRWEKDLPLEANLSKLKTETNTPLMRRRIRAAARAAKLGNNLGTHFEHGQWWVTNRRTGAQWSVCDAEGNGSFDGFGFEQVTAGDEV